MKKFFLLLIIASIHISCKCGCDFPPTSSPMALSSGGFNLVVRNATGQDLLNSEIPGSYKKDEIKLYNQQADGTKKPIAFTINKPIIKDNYRLEYFQLNSSQILPTRIEKKDITYIQFRDETPYMVEIITTANIGGKKSDFMELSINRQQIERDVKLKDYIKALFYFTKQ